MFGAVPRPPNYPLHREDKSFDLLDLSCLKTSCGGAEYRKVVAWPAEYFIPRLKIILLQCSGGVAGWSCLSGFYGGVGAVFDETRSRSNFRPTASIVPTHPLVTSQVHEGSIKGQFAGRWERLKFEDPYEVRAFRLLRFGA